MSADADSRLDNRRGSVSEGGLCIRGRLIHQLIIAFCRCISTIYVSADHKVQCRNAQLGLRQRDNLTHLSTSFTVMVKTRDPCQNCFFMLRVYVKLNHHWPMYYHIFFNSQIRITVLTLKILCIRL